MKRIRLSTGGERSGAVFLGLIILLLIIFLAKSFTGDTLYTILIILCSLIAFALAAAYIAAVFKAAVEFSGKDELKVLGLITITENCSEAASVKTVPVSKGPLQSRSIVISNSSGESIAVITTMFTLHEGVMAEPAAEELAKGLGLEFIPSVEKWKYDPEAKAEHKAELIRLKKENRKHRRKGSTNNKNIESEDYSDDINYDRLDDEK